MKKFMGLLISLFFAFFSSLVVANDLQDQLKEQVQKTYKAALAAATNGPANITLLDQAVLKLPKDYMFIPKDEANEFMRALGNPVNTERVGLVMPTNTDPWIITINFVKEGYIKDDEAKNWNADELLKNLKAASEEANKERVARGFDPVEVDGWIESPNYNAATHHLVWSLRGKNKDEENSVNYNTYALGRDGYFSVNLLTTEPKIQQDKQNAHEILAALQYNKGKQYQDFVASTDKVAAYGIAALVTGVVAKKLGLLAMAGVFLIKIWKFLILIPVLLFSRIKKLFKRS